MDILGNLLGGVDPKQLLKTLARFMKETRQELKEINRKLDLILAKEDITVD